MSEGGADEIIYLPKLLHTLESLRSHERWARTQLEAHQAETLHQLRAYAYTHSPFYQKFHRGLMDRPLTQLPVLTKTMLMEHFDEFVTDSAIHLDAVRAHAANDKDGIRFRNRYWVTATSGSSGHPGFFLFDENEWATIMASFACGQEWSGVRVSLAQRSRMATVASISPWHMSSQVTATAKIWWRPSLRLPASQPLVPAHPDEREAADEILDTLPAGANGWSDKGFIGENWQAGWKAEGVRLWSAKRENQHEQHPPAFDCLLNTVRERIETTYDQLKEGGRSVEHTLAKTIDGWCARIITKITSLTLRLFLEKFFGIDVLTYTINPIQ